MDTLSGESSKLGQQRSQHLHRTLNSPVEYPTALPQDQYGLPTRGLTTQNLDAPQLPVEDYPVQTFSGFPEHSRAPDGYPLSTAWFPAGPSRSQSEGKSPTAMYEDFYQQRAAHLAHGYQLPRTFCPAGPSRSQDEGMQPNAPNHHMPQQGTVDVAQESLLFGQLTPFPAEPWSTQHHGVQSSTPEQRPFHPHSPSRRRVHLANQPPLQGPSPTCRQVNVACLEDPFVEASAALEPTVQETVQEMENASMDMNDTDEMDSIDANEELFKTPSPLPGREPPWVVDAFHKDQIRRYRQEITEWQLLIEERSNEIAECERHIAWLTENIEYHIGEL